VSVRAVVVIGLSGCASQEWVDLPDVPIVGGTPAQRALAREELASFDALVGPGRVVLKEVAFGRVPDFAVGSYNRRRGRIEVSEAGEVSSTRVVVRHELCHAIADHHDLVEQPVPFLDAIGDAIYADGGIAADVPNRSARWRRSEALAQLCEGGAVMATALAESCPGEDPDFAAGFRFLLEEVWQEYVEPAAPPPLGGPIASIEVPAWAAEAEVGFGVGVAEGEDLLHLRYGNESEVVHLLTGQRWDGDFPSRFVSPPEDVPDGIPPGGYVPETIGWEEGPAVAEMWFTIFGPGWNKRLLWSDGGAWAFVPDGCVTWDSQRTDLFAAQGRVWFAWLDGGVASWVPVGE
jgi:hypothetical protein